MAEGYTIQWPTATKFKFNINFRGVTDLGFYYEGNSFSQAEHSGTHTDAPAHFAKGSWRIGDIPFDRLFGPGVLIDVADSAQKDPDYLISVNDVMEHEEKYGQIPHQAIVLLNTGQWKHYANRTRYFGYPSADVEPNNVKDLHFPGLHPDAAEWLIENRNPLGIGIDTASIDRGQSTEFKTHRVMGKNNVWGLENLNNLDILPKNQSFTVHNMVLKLKDGSGGPSRVFATFASKNKAPTASLAHKVIVGLGMMSSAMLDF